MNERPTPETDAHIKTLEETPWSHWVYADFARKLERERDEAIADRDILRIDAQSEAEHHDRMVSELEKVYKERDEARKLCQLAHDRILRGDNDREILDILAKGWRAAK